MQQIAAPQGGGAPLRRVNGQCRFTPAQPALRVRVAQGRVIDGVNGTTKTSVIPSSTQLIDGCPAIRVCSGIGIGLLQNRLHGPVSQLPTLGFLHHPEIRGQVQQMGIGTQQRGAERMNRGNLRQVDQTQLPLQMAVGGVQRQPFSQLGGDFGPQFRSRRLGIGDN